MNASRGTSRVDESRHIQVEVKQVESHVSVQVEAQVESHVSVQVKEAHVSVQDKSIHMSAYKLRQRTSRVESHVSVQVEAPHTNRVTCQRTRQVDSHVSVQVEAHVSVLVETTSRVTCQRTSRGTCQRTSRGTCQRTSRRTSRVTCQRTSRCTCQRTSRGTCRHTSRVSVQVEAHVGIHQRTSRGTGQVHKSNEFKIKSIRRGTNRFIGVRFEAQSSVEQSAYNLRQSACKLKHKCTSRAGTNQLDAKVEAVFIQVEAQINSMHKSRQKSISQQQEILSDGVYNF